MREREREVQMSRSAQEKEWDKEKDQLRKTEAHQHFKALLVDMVSGVLYYQHLTVTNGCRESSEQYSIFILVSSLD